jgi:hypothetical protein
MTSRVIVGSCTDAAISSATTTEAAASIRTAISVRHPFDPVQRAQIRKAGRAFAVGLRAYKLLALISGYEATENLVDLIPGL